MICPKCGFNQPEDIYCARCGVHVKKYHQKQKKKTLIILASVLIIIGGAALFTGRVYREKGAGVAVVRSPSPAVTQLKKPSRVIKPKRASSPPKRSSTARSNGQKEKLPVATTESQALAGPQSPAVDTPSNKEEKGRTEKEKDDVLSALQWFERGTALNDDSTAEIACYQKAIELDPAFAPAYYRLGAIYFRNAEYDLADQAFARFLKFATDEQKGIYDIYVFYSPTEVEGLGGEESQPDSAIASKKQPSGQDKSASPGQGENSESKAEHPKEMQAAIPFETLGDHIIVMVRLNRDITARMLLDTGAGITVLSTSLAEKVNLTTDGTGTILLKTLTRKVRAPLARIPQLQVGSHTKEDFPVAVCDMRPIRDSFEGILGMDFLQGFTITVDAEAKKISLSTAGSQKEEAP
jgi:predicted aspartyl protease